MLELIALRLASHYDVTFVTTAHRGPTVRHDGLQYRELPIGWAGPRGGQLLFHIALPFLARRIPHDVWVENFTPPFSTSFLPLFSRADVIGLAQSLSGEQMSRRYRLPFSFVERFGLRFYRHVVVLNPADEVKVRQLGAAEQKIHVIPPGVRLPVIDRSFGGGEHILFLGRVDTWHKGIDLLLDAYHRSGVDMPLLIAGSGTEREERRLADLLSASSGNVRAVGRVTGDRKHELLTRSAFVVMPSRVEAFGISALEGMAYGKPIVHFDLPTLGWISGDVRVPMYDVDALAREIRSLVNSKEARQKLGEAGHAAAQSLSEDVSIGRYFEIVKQVLDA